MREIADAAGILSGSLYHHFDSKESIVDELLSSFLAETMAAYQAAIAAAGNAHRRVARARADRVRGRARPPRRGRRDAPGVPHALAVSALRVPAHGLRRRRTRVARRARAPACARGEFRRAADPALTYRFIRDAVWNTVRWYEPSGRYRIDTIANRYLDLLLDGLRSTP